MKLSYKLLLFMSLCFAVVATLAALVVIQSKTIESLKQARSNDAVEGLENIEYLNRSWAQAVGLNYSRGCIEALKVAYSRVPREQAAQCRGRGSDIGQKLLNFVDGDQALEDTDIPLTPSTIRL